MSESVSGQAQGGWRPPAASAAPVRFHDPRTFVDHAYPEQSIDLGEVRMNYARTGSPSNPALLLIPDQTESWWGYEKAMEILAADFKVFAVDVRGHGRSCWTPGRYTLDNMGNDLVRFIDTVIGRPVITSGCSSRRRAVLLAGGLRPAGSAAGRGARRPAPVRLGDHASGRPVHPAGHRRPLSHQRHLAGRPVADRRLGRLEEGAASRSLAGPAHVPFPRRTRPEPEGIRPRIRPCLLGRHSRRELPARPDARPGESAGADDPHARFVFPEDGRLMGALSDVQAAKACAIMREAGAEVDYLSLPDAAHAMHAAQPERFAQAVRDWALKTEEPDHDLSVRTASTSTSIFCRRSTPRA